MLVSRRKRRSIEELVKRIEHVELETTPDFFDVFVEGCQFKPMAHRAGVESVEALPSAILPKREAATQSKMQEEH